MAESILKATRESFGEALCELAETNKDIVVFDEKQAHSKRLTPTASSTAASPRAT